MICLNFYQHKRNWKIISFRFMIFLYLEIHLSISMSPQMIGHFHQSKILFFPLFYLSYLKKIYLFNCMYHPKLYSTIIGLVKLRINTNLQWNHFQTLTILMLNLIHLSMISTVFWLSPSSYAHTKFCSIVLHKKMEDKCKKILE